jgi:hypothetical protein
MRAPVKVGGPVVSIEEFDRIDLNLDYDDNRLLLGTGECGVIGYG